jgi:hypothetical protein
MPVETALLARLSDAMPQGLKRGVENTVSSILKVKGTVAEAATNRELTAVGRAAILKQFAKKEALLDLFKSQRQYGYAKALVDGSRARLHSKVRGEAKATDAEWREIVRKLPAGERAAFVLNNPGARGPVLREPELAFVAPDVIAHVMKREIIEHHERDAALLQLEEQAVEIHHVALREHERAVMSMPIVTTEGSDNVSSFHSMTHLAKWADTELPGASTREISPHERAEIAAAA